MKELEFNEIGIKGEKFAESYCRLNKISFQSASKNEDLVYGIDAYINGCPTDIKNTKDIYFLRLTEEGNYSTRHPFRSKSQATHYFFVNVSNTNNLFIEFVSIKEKLLRDFIVNEKSLKSFLNFVKCLNNKSYHKFGLNSKESCLKIKEKLIPYLKDNVTISFEEPTNNTISFKIMEKIKNEITKKDISFAKSLIKKNLKGKVEVSESKIKKSEENKFIEDVIKVEL